MAVGLVYKKLRHVSQGATVQFRRNGAKYQLARFDYRGKGRVAVLYSFRLEKLFYVDWNRHCLAYG